MPGCGDTERVGGAQGILGDGGWAMGECRSGTLHQG